MSYCTNCGAQEIEGQQFCPVCGAQKRGTFSPSAMPPLSYDAVGTAAEVRIGLSLEPPRHSRWTVLLRALLALPLFVVAELGFILGLRGEVLEAIEAKVGPTRSGRPAAATASAS